MAAADEYRFLNDDGRLTSWPSKRSDKRLVLAYLAGKFELGTSYTEAEVNKVLKAWHTFADWPLLRRELCVEGFLERTTDGSDYHVSVLPTSIAALQLVLPNVERDATSAILWLQGEEGRATLKLMGNSDEHNKPSTLEEEQERTRQFITATDQLTWMLRYENQIVGAIWVSLNDTHDLNGPSIHMMIGDPRVRGQGIGLASTTAVIAYLTKTSEYKRLYSRYLLENLRSKALLQKLGFQLDGKPYQDRDGLSFQNVVLQP